MLTPELGIGEERRYRDVATGELKAMMAKRWRYREGTIKMEDTDKDTSQDEFVFNQLKI